jgi:hypothetical protein
VNPRNPIVRIIAWIVDAVISVVEKRANDAPVDRPPPVQPYPRSASNGHWDEEKTDPQIPAGDRRRPRE